MGESVVEEVVVVPVSAETPQVSQPPIEKKRFLGFFGRKPDTQTPKEFIEAVAKQPTESEPPAQETPNTEAEVNPEELKDNLRADLGRVVDLQVEAYFKTQELRSRGANYEGDPEVIAAKAEITRLTTESKELSAGLIERLNESRKTLGNFCKVVENEEGNAVILLAPLTREVTQTVLGHYGEIKGKPLYKQMDTVNDVFYINKGGIMRLSFEDSGLHHVESMGYLESDGRDGKRLKDQGEAEIVCLDRREREWRSGLALVLDEPENIGNHVYLTPREMQNNPTLQKRKEDEATQLRTSTINSLVYPTNRQEGVEERYAGLAEPLQSEINSRWGGQRTVTTSLDAMAAFDASVEQGAKYKGDNEPKYLFGEQPNPVSAEPMSTTPSEPESVPTEVLQTPTDATSAETFAGEAAPGEKQVAATEDETPDPSSAPSSDFTQS